MNDSSAGLTSLRRQMGNGAVAIASESRAMPAVTISAALDAGGALDPPLQPGLMHFLARTIDRGSARRSANEIAEMLDVRGVSLSVAAMRHLFVVSCTCLSEDFEAMMSLVGEVLRQPALPETEVETRRGEIVTAIRQDQDNPAVVAVEEQLARLYPDGHPYGQRVKGTLESVASIDREALAAAHRARFGPESLVVVTVGDVEAARAVDEAERMFGDWAGAGRAREGVPTVSRPGGRRRAVFPMMNKAQADIAYGFNTIARRDPSYYAFSVLNNVLGQYALGGRLGDRIREREGMAYYVFTAFEPNVGEGPLVIRAGVNPANVDRTLAAVDDELRVVRSEGVTPRELAESKQYLVGSMPRMLETNAGIAGFLHTCEHFDLGLDYDRRLP
ncbi:MAG: insulinase family protein, partial [Acidobacteria bacterium]